MSHRPQDTYKYVATQTIRKGMVTSFNEGDPVPESTADREGYVDAGLVVTREEWSKRSEKDTGSDSGAAKDTPKGDDSATSKSARTGGASRRTPDTGKSE